MGKFSSLGLNISTGVKMPLEHPVHGLLKDNDGKEAYLELLSPGSERGRAHANRITGRAFERMRRPGGRAKLADDLTDSQVDQIVSLMTGWYLVAPDGTPLNVEFNEENAREFLADDEMYWAREAALNFINDAANFIKASSGS